MILQRERLSYQRGDVGNNICMFTANSVIKNDGKLVMGAGVAKVVRDFYQGIDKLFGLEIEHMSKFGVKFVKWNGQNIGAFQTKYNWTDSSPLELVECSVRNLKFVADNRPHHTFHLPCPAVNHGRQSVEDVLPLLEILPDNVIIYLDK